MDSRTCTACETERPLSDFAKDARLKSGVRAVCKPCDRAALAGRRPKPKPLALVLAPKFPAPPTPLEVQLGKAFNPPPVGDYAAAAEAFIAALVPPAGPADALHVRALRHLAELIDLRVHPASIDAVKDATAIVAKLVAVQSALLVARRGEKAKPEQANRLASGQF